MQQIKPISPSHRLSICPASRCILCSVITLCDVCARLGPSAVVLIISLDTGKCDDLLLRQRNRSVAEDSHLLVNTSGNLEPPGGSFGSVGRAERYPPHGLVPSIGALFIVEDGSIGAKVGPDAAAKPPVIGAVASRRSKHRDHPCVTGALQKDRRTQMVLQFQQDGMVLQERIEVPAASQFSAEILKFIGRFFHCCVQPRWPPGNTRFDRQASAGRRCGSRSRSPGQHELAPQQSCLDWPRNLCASLGSGSKPLGSLRQLAQRPRPEKSPLATGWGCRAMSSGPAFCSRMISPPSRQGKKPAFLRLSRASSEAVSEPAGCPSVERHPQA